MFLRINHKTKYRYEKPFQSLTQSIKLFPTKLKGVKILSWKVSVKNAYIGEKVIESNGDQTIVAHTSKNNKSSEIIVTGQVQTSDNNGIILGHKEKINPLVYLRETDLTKSDSGIKKFVSKLLTKNKKKNKLSFAHSLNSAIFDHIEYSSGTSEISTPATNIFNSRKGVCQDFAHLMISSSIYAGIPARYVVGYLLPTDIDTQATHAWVELFFNDIGWIAFDPSNNSCTNDRYLRLCSGPDSISAAPIKGVAIGSSDEKLDVKVSVQQIPQQ
ncbi:transglutaminase family protein [bacterium]|nr:transglutaminase family protein [bacterium]|tara:strand:- start:379 stop:1194 length:816 start_codon:yes stop_codon:yes gene_type:complete